MAEVDVFDEQAFIERVESADADELADILRRPSPEQDRALRAFLGETNYQRQRDLTLRREIQRSRTRQPAGNVVVLHGIMGSELSAFSRAGSGDPIWVKVFRIVEGALARLQLGEDGLKELDEEFDVRPTGILKRHYGEMLLSLATQWQVRAFWFDWRKDLEVAAAQLETSLRGWFGRDEPVHLVAHSMGGLVARTLLAKHRDCWKALQGADGSGGRLVMLGTPNHGSFVIPQVMASIESTVKKIALLDLRHSSRELERIFNSFPGLYQMLPSPCVQNRRWSGFYERDTYGSLEISPRHLDAARAHHELLVEAIDSERMIYVAGANQPTFEGLDDLSRLGDASAYHVTLAGDGRVPHALGLLDGVPTYYIEERHGDLSVNARVLGELDWLLKTGECALETSPPKDRSAEADAQALQERVLLEQEGEERRVRELATALGSRGATSDGAQTYGGSTERELEELVVREFLGARVEAPRVTERRRQVRPRRIRIALVHGRIEEIGDGGEPLIDAIAVGHYVGVKPQEAELALDQSISAALAESHDGRSAERLLLTDYSERGVIRGELGQPFFLEDPRGGTEGASRGRLIVVAGMGLPGRFGPPELAVLARELVWCLGRLGKRHLATVLIGGGAGSIDIGDDVEAWLRGIREAIIGSADRADAQLEQITFVEASAAKLRRVQEAILRSDETFKASGDPLRIDYHALKDDELTDFERIEGERELEKLRHGLNTPRRMPNSEPVERAPTRLTLSLDNGTYTFGAITHDAALPERRIPVDPKLVAKANDELVSEWRPQMQWERGQLLDRLLIPDDLRPHLASNAPIVMLLDATTARIHWEMVAPPGPRLVGLDPVDNQTPDVQELARVFLGTSRGLTRQLRTTFAPPPEAPPPPRRVLRVLVVADPAADAPLGGAEEEGVAVADLFESFNDIVASEAENRVVVDRLLGPNAATRTAVLRHLAVRTYDVLHYAGHCVYEEDDPARQEPARQGWLFSGGELLSPNELNRIDRIPKFVFSNACQSGVTPDRADRRAASLAPSFAESFFARGVSNFVCTAWPVADGAARDFALTLYSNLLGMSQRDQTEPRAQGGVDSWRPQVMHEAMRTARLSIFDTLDGHQTWGAYQHYGNPYFRFFENSGRESGRTDTSAKRRRHMAQAARS